MEFNQECIVKCKNELLLNLMKHTNNYIGGLTIQDYIEECVWYSCLMSLRFYYDKDTIQWMSKSRINNITYNVCLIMNQIDNRFDSSLWENIINQVEDMWYENEDEPSQIDIFKKNIIEHYSKYGIKETID